MTLRQVLVAKVAHRVLESSPCLPEDCCKTDPWESNWNLGLIEQDVEEELAEVSKGPDSSPAAQYPHQSILYLPGVRQDDQAWWTPTACRALSSCCC